MPATAERGHIARPASRVLGIVLKPVDSWRLCTEAALGPTRLGPSREQNQGLERGLAKVFRETMGSAGLQDLGCLTCGTLAPEAPWFRVALWVSVVGWS